MNERRLTEPSNYAACTDVTKLLIEALSETRNKSVNRPFHGTEMKVKRKAAVKRMQGGIVEE